MASQKSPEGSMELILVEPGRAANDFEERVGERRGVAAIDRKQDLPQRRSHLGVDAPHQAEVQQRKLPVGEEKDVARVRVGVEDPVDQRNGMREQVSTTFQEHRGELLLPSAPSRPADTAGQRVRSQLLPRLR
jgi:hypothetical protein